MRMSNIIALSPALRHGAAALCLTGAMLAGTASYAAPAPDSFAPLVNKVKPAVVNIATTQLPGTQTLYRFYDPSTNDHLYTLDQNGESAPSYHFELVVGFVNPGP